MPLLVFAKVVDMAGAKSPRRIFSNATKPLMWSRSKCEMVTKSSVGFVDPVECFRSLMALVTKALLEDVPQS